MENKLLKDILVIIPAGGKSSRLWPLSDKHTLRFLGKPLIHYCLLNLQKFGFKKLVIVVNSANKSQIHKWIDRYPGLDISLVEQSDQRGMAGAILSVKKIILGNKVLIIKPSDLYENHIFFDFVKLLQNNPQCILTGIKTDSYFPGGYFKIDSKNKISGIIEKPDPLKLPSNITSLVFDYFASGRQLIESILQSSTKEDDLYEIAKDQLIKSGIKLLLLHYRGYWGYLQYPWHVLNLTSHFLENLKKPLIKRGKISKSAVISGNVMLDNDVTILENVKILGPSYIGQGSIIGNNSVIRSSVIGNNCVVGFSTEVARSYIGDNCWFHSNYIGDSVVMDNVSLGAGTVLANLRLDEKMITSAVKNKTIATGKFKLGAMIGQNVRIGVNTSLMPGVKIGSNCLITSGLVIDRDIPEHQFVANNNGGLKLTENNLQRVEYTRDGLKNNLKF